jgi:hypothetical protein
MGVRAPAAVQSAVARRRRAIEALLADGWQRYHPYKKWQGAHWRLLSLCELGVRDDPRPAPMIDAALDWLTNDRHRARIATIDGRTRRCASQEGNALLAATLLGYATDPRATVLARSLVLWQWPDGGWNCDVRPGASHSSFHETLAPLRGLAAYGKAMGDLTARVAARRAAELLLAHELVRSHTAGEVIDPEWLRIHWPAYWHYDALQALRGLHAVGQLRRPEAERTLVWLEGTRDGDGGWAPSSGRRYWRTAANGRRSNVDVVDWNGLDADIVSEQALTVLAAAGRTLVSG